MSAWCPAGLFPFKGVVAPWEVGKVSEVAASQRCSQTGENCRFWPQATLVLGHLDRGIMLLYPSCISESCWTGGLRTREPQLQGSSFGLCSSTHS